MRRAFKTGSTRYKGPKPWFRRAARCSFLSFAKPEQHSGATLMKNDVENGTGVPAPLVSRRTFMLAAAATGSAGIVSAAGPALRGDRPGAAQLDHRRESLERPL